MKRYTHLIWDFNGTLLDDVQACIKSANSLLAAHGLPLLQSEEQYRSLFGFPIVDYYRRLGFDFEKLPYADLAVEWVAYYLEHSKDARLYPDVIGALETARDLGFSQLILSATELGMLERQVVSLGIRPYFNELLGLENIQAHSKEAIGLAWHRNHPDAHVLYIGDTDHDAQVAAAMGADCILLSCGHQSRTALEACPALFIADSLSEVFTGDLLKAPYPLDLKATPRNSRLSS